MTKAKPVDFAKIRSAMAKFSPAPKTEPNQSVRWQDVFTPLAHRAVLDLSRQMVVGNRGMGKSFWTHALVDHEVREQLSQIYDQPILQKTVVQIGFNGSEALSRVAPTRDAISTAMDSGSSEDEIWKAVIFRAASSACGKLESLHLRDTLAKLKRDPVAYEEALYTADEELSRRGTTLLILFDALDRLADDWQRIRGLTTSLLKRALGLKSYRSLRTKVFMRPDQFADRSIFQFPDGSKLKNDHVDLQWQPQDLYGLLFFEILRTGDAGQELTKLASGLGAAGALRFRDLDRRSLEDDQKKLIDALAGPFMGSDARRGRVYTWVPLHLSDARQVCSPRTFLTAWQKAAEHPQTVGSRAVDHLGLIEGVRQASGARLAELREDYRWIDDALGALEGAFVPLERDDLFDLWENSDVAQNIVKKSKRDKWLAPVELGTKGAAADALLEAMKNISVMEERANGKINVPDIFRVEAGIKRKGGVAVPRRS